MKDTIEINRKNLVNDKRIYFKFGDLGLNFVSILEGGKCKSFYKNQTLDRTARVVSRRSSTNKLMQCKHI